jgi:hypothetical protein
LFGGFPRRCAPPAARHYLHEDPEEQGSHPDLDGQLPHGAARTAPAAAADALRGSRSSARAARQILSGEGGALQAAGGGGRRAPGGGVRETGRAQPKPPAWPGAPGRRTGLSLRLGPRVRARRKGASGTPSSLAPGAASASRARAGRPRPGEGKPGEALSP